MGAGRQHSDAQALTVKRVSSEGNNPGWTRAVARDHPASPSVFAKPIGGIPASTGTVQGIHTSRKVSEDRETWQDRTGRPSMRPGRAGADGSSAARPEIAVLMPETPSIMHWHRPRPQRAAHDSQHVLGMTRVLTGICLALAGLSLSAHAMGSARGRRLSQCAPGQNGRGRTNPDSVHEEGAGVLGIHAGNAGPIGAGRCGWTQDHGSLPARTDDVAEADPSFRELCALAHRRAAQ